MHIIADIESFEYILAAMSMLIVVMGSVLELRRHNRQEEEIRRQIQDSNYKVDSIEHRLRILEIEFAREQGRSEVSDGEES